MTRYIAAIIWTICVLLACGSEGTKIRRQPIEGLGGYEVILREARPPQPERVSVIREPQATMYRTPEGVRAQEITHYETQSSLREKPSLSPVEGSKTQNLRRKRLKLRRNRYLILKERQAEDIP